MDLLDTQACYRALQTRDDRFDGRLFVGVATTGIYCRPICPARTPKFENCRFFCSAAAAQQAGFRPCLRCRPETAPDLSSWRGTSGTVSRALALLSESALDVETPSIERLAERLGMGSRQLRRLFKQHLGTTPIAVAQTRRVLFAKQLIHKTQLSMAELALAAGFGSVRRFNETFQALFHRPPAALRRKASISQSASGQVGVTLELRYRPPYDWASLLGFLEMRAIRGVECVASNSYCRSILHDGQTGVVCVSHLPARHALSVKLRFPSVRALPAVVARVRRVFDLNADVETIGAHLAADPLLAQLVAQRPGLRVPGGWDGFELAVRAILGQQVTLAAGRQLANSLVELCGGRLAGDLIPDHPGLFYVFPTPNQLLAGSLDSLKMPASRKGTLKALAEVATRDPNLFRPFGSVEEAVARLRNIPGIGEWTAQYIALRALHETDAFPASDIGLLRGIAGFGAARPTSTHLLAMAEPWRPWRAYAAQHIWTADAATRVLHA